VFDRRAAPGSDSRKDFDAAGVVQSDEQILRVMNELARQLKSE
jgi:hypothetical protein